MLERNLGSDSHEKDRKKINFDNLYYNKIWEDMIRIEGKAGRVGSMEKIIIK